MKQITFNQYRQIDIILLCIITAVFEGIACIATTEWFSLQAMAISITFTMVCITALRWGALSILPSFVGAFVYCVFSGANVRQFVVYCGGSLFCLITIPLLNKLSKEKVRLRFNHRLCYVSTTYLAITIGRWIISLIFELTFVTFLPFITTDILSLLFAIVVLSALKSSDGLLEDQKSYLLRLEKERIEAQETNLNNQF